MSSPVAAQWFHRPTPGIPRTKDGKPDLSAPAPRLADGKPDLGGVWLVPGLKYLINIAADLKEVPFQPWAEAEYKRRMETRGKDDPNNFCLPSGIPEKDAVTSPWKIVQTPGLILILYESRTIYRQIFMDGRPLPEDPNPTWQGYSVGHWDGDTLVVDTVGPFFATPRMLLDTRGHPVSEDLHVVERFHRIDATHLGYEVTVEDPKMYTKPFTNVRTWVLMPKSEEILEYVCTENNKEVEEHHIK